MNKSLAAVCAVVVASALSASAADPDAKTLLRSSLNTPKVSYQGQMTMTHWHDDHSDSSDVHVYFRPPSYYRWEYLSPDGSTDRVVISDGTREDVHLISAKTVLHGRAAGSIPKRLSSEQEWTLMTENYSLDLRESATIAGRMCWVVDLTPITPGKASQRLWIDQKTGVTLAVKRFRPHARLAAESEFVRFDTGGTFPMDLFALSKNPPASDNHGYDPDFYSLEELQKATGRKTRVPKTLPYGFSFESASYLIVDGKNVDHFRYTDGLSVVSVFQTSHPVALHLKKPPRADTVPAGAAAWPPLETHDVGHVVQKKLDGMHYTVIGDVSEASLQSILDALH